MDSRGFESAVMIPVSELQIDSEIRIDANPPSMTGPDDMASFGSDIT